MKAAPNAPDMKSNLPSLISKYKTYLNSKPSYRIDLINTAWREVSLPKNDSCVISSTKLKDRSGINDSDRIAYYLNTTTKKIIVFNSINGDIKEFAKCKQYIDDNNLLEDTIVIFSPPFYDLDPQKDMYNLFANFLDLKLKSPDTIFNLCEHTYINKFVGCILTEGDSEPILNMLEPSYILLPTLYMLEGKESSGLLFRLLHLERPPCQM